MSGTYKQPGGLESMLIGEQYMTWATVRVTRLQGAVAFRREVRPPCADTPISFYTLLVARLRECCHRRKEPYRCAEESKWMGKVHR